MRRYGNLYGQICDPDNIKIAFANASRGKAHYREVKAFNQDYEANIEEVRRLLVDKTFRNAPYKQFVSNQYGKRREISKLPFYATIKKVNRYLTLT